MKTIEKQFTKNGFTHTQITREGDVAIYRRTKNEQEHFEVVVIQRHHGLDLHGVFIPPSEFYPSTERWGRDAFTFSPESHADPREASDGKMRQLLARHDAPRA